MKLTKLDRVTRFKNVDEPIKDYKKVTDLKELHLGGEVYWEYSGRIKIKGYITREDQGYITDFNHIINMGVLYIKKEQTPVELKEIVKEQFKGKKESPKSTLEQLTLF